MATQGIQGHDILPRGVFTAFSPELSKWLPGWSVDAEYNFDARPSSQMGAAQLGNLLHSGPHRWINTTVTGLMTQLKMGSVANFSVT